MSSQRPYQQRPPAPQRARAPQRQTIQRTGQGITQAEEWTGRHLTDVNPRMYSSLKVAESTGRAQASQDVLPVPLTE